MNIGRGLYACVVCMCDEQVTDVLCSKIRLVFMYTRNVAICWMVVIVHGLGIWDINLLYQTCGDMDMRHWVNVYGCVCVYLCVNMYVLARP